MELAALGLRVDGISGVEKAATALDDLAKSGSSATSAVKGLGAASSAAAGPIDQAAAAEKRLADAAAKAGMSTAQMNAALRGVPAQFTDIVVSLQSGQNPLTVFLQQGGQLKDMFGGAGNAARALGGYIVSAADVCGQWSQITPDFTPLASFATSSVTSIICSRWLE